MRMILFLYDYQIDIPTGHWLLDYQLYFEVLYICVLFSMYTEYLPVCSLLPNITQIFSRSIYSPPLQLFVSHQGRLGQPSREMRRSSPSIIRSLSRLSM